MITIPQRLGIDIEGDRKMFDQFDFGLRVAMPGIIASFDAEKQTVTVDIAITERIRCDAEAFVQEYGSNVAAVEIPTLLDVPIVFPRAGGFSMTMPIEVGDECLVIFADTCIDGWWQNGNVQDQMSIRRHDLSDAFAILGCWSQPNIIEDYSEDTLQIRTDDGGTIIELEDGVVTISVGEDTSVVVKDGEVTINSTKINLSDDSGLRAFIDERLIALYNAHVHPDPVSGSTGVPTVALTSANCATTKVKGL